MEEVARKPLTLIEVLGVLKRRQNEGELGYEQQATLEYVEKFAKLNMKKVTRLRRELAELGADEETVVSIINLLPKRPEEVRAMLAREAGSKISGDFVKNVLEILKGYRT